MNSNILNSTSLQIDTSTPKRRQRSFFGKERPRDPAAAAQSPRGIPDGRILRRAANIPREFLRRGTAGSRLFCLLVLVALLLPPPGPWSGSAAAQGLPPSAFVNGVVGHPQTYNLSCESRAAADWAAFWGVNVSETEFLNRLPVSDNPDEGFVGSPHGVWGGIPPAAYGVHAGPVAGLLQEYGIDARARHGMTWDELRAEVAEGRPVIIWIIGAMWGGTPVEYRAASGKTAIVARYEHAMIFTGYDASYVYVIDSYSGYNQVYTVNAFLKSWAVLGNMAVTGPAKATAPTENNLPATYVVQPGDYLAEIARRFGLHWMDIANLNGLVYPYTIYPGQVLKLPGGTAPDEQEPTPEPDKPPELPLLDNAIWLPLVIQAKSEEEPAAPDPEPVPVEYIVQKGDYLIELARRFNLNWEDIARLNNLGWPYTLYPGQVLKLR